MKKYLFMLLVLGGLLAISGSAMAWSPGGAVDTFKASAVVANNDEAEVAWVNDVLGTSYKTTDLFKYNTTPMIWEWTDGRGIWAIEFETKQAGYFFIQTWNQRTPNHFLYQNIDDLAWGVVNLGAQGYSGFVQLWGISNVGEIGGSTQVPEPSLLLLLGTGLVGIGAATWRKIK